MKPGIRIVKYNYYINQDNGTVTCVLYCNTYLYSTALGSLIKSFSPGSINYKNNLPNGIFIVRGYCKVLS